MSNIVTRVLCDGDQDCPNIVRAEGGAEQALEKARNHGWLIDHNRHYCPDHKLGRAMTTQQPAHQKEGKGA